MKKKVIIIICIVLVFILLIPIPMHLKDGGTVKYQAILYSVSKVHKLPMEEDEDYEEGTIIEVLGMEIYNNVK